MIADNYAPRMQAFVIVPSPLVGEGCSKLSTDKVG